ncbi:unnamed protein product [[Candida] boidinii]|nr:unnamed protein product [[Candida] boidinii]
MKEAIDEKVNEKEEDNKKSNEKSESSDFEPKNSRSTRSTSRPVEENTDIKEIDEESDAEEHNEDEDDEFHEDDDDEDVDEEDYDEDEEAEESVVRRSSKVNGRQSSATSSFGLKTTSITGYFKAKPALLSKEIELKSYQQVGINWLSLLYRKNLSCILADEMGLGKTAQVIAFLAHLKEYQNQGPHLIVVPSSTLENWLREFNKFAPTLNVRPYYGSQDARVELRAELENDDTYDVLVTTYNLAAGNKYDQAFLRSRSFNVVVYDEGHMLKNSNSERYAKLMKISANFRLLLTGTPLQNNLKELISLLSFILPKVFKEKREDLQSLFDQKVTTRDTSIEQDGEKYNPLLSEQAITNARTMMAPFVLRRKKDQVMKHLPAKHNSIKYCELTEIQKELYNEQIKNAKLARDERERRKLMSQDEVKLLPKSENTGLSTTNLLMALRKSSLHPLLFRKRYTDDKLKTMAKKIMKSPEYRTANEQYILEDMEVMTDFELNELCIKFPKQLGEFILDKEIFLDSGKVKIMMDIINQVIVKKEKILVFSLFTQVLDILEKVLSYYNLKFLRLDGSTSVDERQDIIDKFYDDQTIPVFLLSTKAGGFGINLICANNVIIYDQSFNPHDEKQAEDRAHRVGQTKEVNVYRLITKKTVEENIAELAENKLQLDSSMSGEAGKQIEEKASKMVEELLEKDSV